MHLKYMVGMMFWNYGNINCQYFNLVKCSEYNNIGIGIYILNIWCKTFINGYYFCI